MVRRIIRVKLVFEIYEDSSKIYETERRNCKD